MDASEGPEATGRCRAEVKVSRVPAADLLRMWRVVVTQAVYWKDTTKAVGTLKPCELRGRRHGRS